MPAPPASAPAARRAGRPTGPWELQTAHRPARRPRRRSPFAASKDGDHARSARQRQRSPPAARTKARQARSPARRRHSACGSASFTQTPCVQAVAGSENDVLLTVEQIRDDAARFVRIQLVMPQDLAFIGTENDQVLLVIA